jgi:hypothetical protein
MISPRGSAGRGGVAITYNEHLNYDGSPAVFKHACRLGLEGMRVKAAGCALSQRAIKGRGSNRKTRSVKLCGASQHLSQTVLALF